MALRSVTVSFFWCPSRLTVIASVLLLLTIIAWHTEVIGGELTATWIDNSRAGCFSVERRIGKTGKFEAIGVTGISSYTDTTVDSANTYCYRVRAFDASSYSGYSNVSCATAAAALTLAVVKVGQGSGTVISTPPGMPPGIYCGTSCSGAYPSGAVATLTATPAEGSTFAGWSGGGCSGTGSCAVTLTANAVVLATFDPAPTPLTSRGRGTSSGPVTRTPTAVNCGPGCSTSLASGTVVTVVAAPTSDFSGASAGCAPRPLTQ
jgi:hypothetical protein